MLVRKFSTTFSDRTRYVRYHAPRIAVDVGAFVLSLYMAVEVFLIKRDTPYSSLVTSMIGL